ncbi:MAG: hypothetical protein JNM84_08770 [Planctomycetes bacterium]|nr:hypothetical protein [Planctomycetota bacterium]
MSAEPRRVASESSREQRSGNEAGAKREKRAASLESRLQQALENVRRLGIEACLRRAHGRLPPLERLSFDVHLDLLQGNSQEEAHRILGAWGESIRQAEALRSAFVPGHVYCFWCNASECAHSRPARATEVFDGYAPTGRPRWIELSDLCLQMQDIRFERILSRSDGVVTFFESGDRLKTAQIDEFGRNSPIYDIVAQIVAGYLHGAEEEGDLAASFQVVATRLGPTEIHYALNVISAPQLYDRSGGLADADLGRMVRALGKRLEQVEHRVNGSSRRGRTYDPSTLIERALRDFARDLDHHYRVAGRRTWHARERSDQGSRPTESAFPEARRAAPERILEDASEGTIVVLGRNGRVHVFARDGRHVTSVRMQGDEIRRRRSTKRWRDAAPNVLEHFRAALSRHDLSSGSA